ncbi:MAG: gliding motility-associated C-terminal domain-containing protein [Sphingobacteriales bacterium]|nr:gliding motility-associated C-terminal domain-containing protein [Sphingobacteriales bacterium]
MRKFVLFFAILSLMQSVVWAQNCSNEQCIEAYTGIDNHAFYLADIAGSPQYFFDSNSGKFEEFPDGTAHLTGVLVNKDDPSKMWAADVWFKNKMDYATWEAMSNPPHYKGDPSNVGLNYLNWTYYTMDSGNDGKKSRLTGGAGSYFDGWELYLTQDTDGNKYTTQVGTAANDFNTEYGMSTWFTYVGHDAQGTAVVQSRGDINIDFCSPCSGAYTLSVPAAFGTFNYMLSPSAGNVSASGSNLTVTGLCAGNYTFYVYYQDGTSQQFPFSIAPSGGSDFTYSVATNDGTVGTCNASAQVTLSLPSGGDYSYTFNESGTVSKNGNVLSLSGLCCGSHSIQVQYGNCTKDISFYTACQTSCNLTFNTLNTIGTPTAACNGSAQVTLTLPEGVSTYTYNYSEGGAVTQNGNTLSLSGLCCGSRTLTVNFGNGCSQNVVVYIPCLQEDCNADTQITTQGTIIGTYNGTATLTVDLPTGISQYSVDFNYPYATTTINNNTVHFTGLVCGSYEATLHYGAGCSQTVSFDVPCLPNPCSEPNDYCVEIGHSIAICPTFCDLTDNFTYNSIHSALGAVVQIQNNCLLYAPLATTLTNDVLTLTATDNTGTTQTIALDIQIGNCDGSFIFAVDDFVQTPYNISIGINVLANDLLPADCGSAVITNISTPSSGSAVILNNLVIYSPSFNFTGVATFEYTVCCTNTGVCDVALVTITVLNQTEICSLPSEVCLEPGETAVVCPQVCEIEDASVSQIISVIGASTQLLPSGCILYTVPENTTASVDTLEIISCNTAGECASNFVYISIGDCPKLGAMPADDHLSIYKNAPAVLDVFANDAMPEGTFVAYFTMPQHGTLEFNANQQFVYQPANDFIGEDYFTYSISRQGEVVHRAAVGIEVRDEVIGFSPIEDIQRQVATGFSPNGDGANDRFFINTVPAMQAVKWIVFDRFGKVILEEDEIANQHSLSWNGTLQNKGEVVAEGTYFYVVEYIMNGKKERFSGMIELQR